MEDPRIANSTTGAASNNRVKASISGDLGRSVPFILEGVPTVQMLNTRNVMREVSFLGAVIWELVVCDTELKLSIESRLSSFPKSTSSVGV